MVECSIESIGGFDIIHLKHNKSQDSKITVIVNTKDGKDFVFLPDMLSTEINVEYPEHSVNMLNRVGKKEYKLYFDSSQNGRISSVCVLIDEDDVVSEHVVDV